MISKALLILLSIKFHQTFEIHAVGKDGVQAKRNLISMIEIGQVLNETKEVIIQ